VCAFFIARHNSRAARKHDTLCAKPLSLSPDEEKAVKVRYARKPKRVIFLATPPHSLQTKDVNAWADAVAPTSRPRIPSSERGGQSHRDCSQEQNTGSHSPD
jgi:hypothetical protein